MFFPIFPFMVACGYVVLWIFSVMYLFSVSKQEAKIIPDNAAKPGGVSLHTVYVSCRLAGFLLSLRLFLFGDKISTRTYGFIGETQICRRSFARFRSWVACDFMPPRIFSPICRIDNVYPGWNTTEQGAYTYLDNVFDRNYQSSCRACSRLSMQGEGRVAKRDRRG